MKLPLRTGEPTPDELVNLLALLNALGWKEWQSPEQRDRVLKLLRLLEHRFREFRRTDWARHMRRIQRGKPLPENQDD